MEKKITIGKGKLSREEIDLLKKMQRDYAEGGDTSKAELKGMEYYLSKIAPKLDNNEPLTKDEIAKAIKLSQKIMLAQQRRAERNYEIKKGH